MPMGPGTIPVHSALSRGSWISSATVQQLTFLNGAGKQFLTELLCLSSVIGEHWVVRSSTTSNPTTDWCGVVPRGTEPQLTGVVDIMLKTVEGETLLVGEVKSRPVRNGVANLQLLAELRMLQQRNPTRGIIGLLVPLSPAGRRSTVPPIVLGEVTENRELRLVDFGDQHDFRIPRTASAPPASQHQNVDVAAEVAALVERQLTEKFAPVEELLARVVELLVRTEETKPSVYVVPPEDANPEPAAHTGEGGGATGDTPTLESAHTGATGDTPTLESAHTGEGGGATGDTPTLKSACNGRHSHSRVSSHWSNGRHSHSRVGSHWSNGRHSHSLNRERCRVVCFSSCMYVLSNCLIEL